MLFLNKIYVIKMQQFKKSVAYSKDMEKQIFFHSDYDTIYISCKNDQKEMSVCLDENFWITKAFIDFDVDKSFFMNTFLFPYERYLQLLTYNNKVAIGAEQFLPEDKFIELSIQTGKYYLLEITNLDFFISTYTTIIREFVKINNPLYVKKWLDKYINKNNKIQFTENIGKKIEFIKIFYPVRTLKMADLLDEYIPGYKEFLAKDKNIIKYANLELLMNLYLDVEKLDYSFFGEILRRNNIEIFKFLVPKIQIKEDKLQFDLSIIYATNDENYIKSVLDYFNVTLDDLDPTNVLRYASETKDLVFFSVMFDKLKDKRILYNFLFMHIAEHSNLDIIIYILNYFNPSINFISSISYNANKRKDTVETLKFLILKYRNMIVNTTVKELIQNEDIKTVVDVILLLTSNNILVYIDLTNYFINAMKVKDKYFMECIIKYRGAFLNYDRIYSEMLNINDIRLKTYIDNLFAGKKLG